MKLCSVSGEWSCSNLAEPQKQPEILLGQGESKVLIWQVIYPTAPCFLFSSVSIQKVWTLEPSADQQWVAVDVYWHLH
jgi:hypothetical protein